MSRFDDELETLKRTLKTRDRRRLLAIVCIGIGIVGCCVAVFFGIASCTPQPQPVPMPPDGASDAAPSTPCEAACDRLRTLGCSDGLLPNCVRGLAQIDGSGKFPTACGSALCPAITCAALATATTIAEARLRGAGCR